MIECGITELGTAKNKTIKPIFIFAHAKVYQDKRILS